MVSKRGISMAQASVNVKMDKALKEDFAKICDDFGMFISEVIREFAKTAVRRKKMPFEAFDLDENGFDAATRAKLNRRIADFKTGRNIVRHGLDEM